MATLDVRLYDAFAASPKGGNVAGVVYASPTVTPETMQHLAAELGAPTTGFVTDLGGATFAVRFFSPRLEMPMCGHVTVGVFASLLDDRLIENGTFRLVTEAGDVPITVERGAEPFITMRQPLPSFDLFDTSRERLALLLGLGPRDIVSTGSCATGLRHLFVEVGDVPQLAHLRVADDRMRDLCREVGIDTVGVFARRGSADGEADLRVRDLCHGVGAPEEAASGTTNGALASLLWRRGMLPGSDASDGSIVVVAEQGFEMGRPSRITTQLRWANGAIVSVEVGGSATRRLEGRLFA
jgi:trans-2,3-dihydro-3-hydroxyanthranilate isomerase